MRRDVYSSDALYKYKDQIMWIEIQHTTPNYDDWVSKYKNKVLPTAHFCTFDGKSITKLAGTVPLATYLKSVKKLVRKNKQAWGTEKKKRDKNKDKDEKKEDTKKKEDTEKKKDTGEEEKGENENAGDEDE